MKRSIAVFALAALLAACGNQCNHHECDVNAYASHCDDQGNLVTCEDETTGEPCALAEGCDTYVTTTVCATSCLATSSSSAACADAGSDLDAGGPVKEDAGTSDASDDAGESDASDADVGD